MRFRFLSIFATVALAFFLAGATACKERSIPDPPAPRPQPEPEPEVVEETILFEERFDRCTLTEGPAIQSDNFKDDCENPLSHISFKSTVWKTVGTSHVCSNEYLNSRGFAPWVLLPGH